MKLRWPEKVNFAWKKPCSLGILLMYMVEGEQVHQRRVLGSSSALMPPEGHGRRFGGFRSGTKSNQSKRVSVLFYATLCRI